MSTQRAAEHFGLFLTALRNSGAEVLLSDVGTAQLIIDALAIINPDGGAEALTADVLHAALTNMIDDEQLASDNGTDDAEED